MLDLFLKLIDRLIGLVKERAETRRTLFTDIVEPLFRDLEPVADDYFSFFDSVRDDLAAAGPQDVPELVEKARKAREAKLRAREKVRSLAKAIHETVDGSSVVAHFAAQVLMFFNSFNLRPSHAEKIVALLDQLSNLDAEQLEERRDELIRYVDFVKANMWHNWEHVASAYADARIGCLTKSTRGRPSQHWLPSLAETLDMNWNERDPD